MYIIKSLVFLILLSCIYNILKILTYKSTSNYNSRYSSSSYNNSKTSFENNVRGHWRRTKTGKKTYVRSHNRKRR